MKLTSPINNIDENATFVGGHRKTGTTMLIDLFDDHPELNVFPQDSAFFYSYFPPYSSTKFSNEDRINRIIDFSYQKLREEVERVDTDKTLNFQFEKLYTTFKGKANESSFTPKEMLLAMMNAYRETIKKM